MSHILLTHHPEEIAQVLALQHPPRPRLDPHVKRRGSLPVFKSSHFEDRTMIEATWGVQVPWGDADDDHMYYVRSDSVEHSRWLDLLPNICPCVIPASAMVHYPSNDSDKPWRLLYRKDREVMLFAGILCSWLAEGGDIHHGCLIISTTAKKSLIPERWRIPYILADDEIDNWLEYDLLRSRSLFRKVDGYRFEQLETMECLSFSEGLESMFLDNRPGTDSIAVRTLSAGNEYSHAVVFRRLPAEGEQRAFNQWFKKKLSESRRLDRPLNTFWPEEETQQKIRVSIFRDF